MISHPRRWLSSWLSRYRRASATARLTIASGGSVVLILAIWMWRLNALEDKLRMDIRSASREVEELRPIVKEVDLFKRYLDELRLRETTLQEIARQQRETAEAVAWLATSPLPGFATERLLYRGGEIRLDGRAACDVEPELRRALAGMEAIQQARVEASGSGGQCDFALELRWQPADVEAS